MSDSEGSIPGDASGQPVREGAARNTHLRRVHVVENHTVHAVAAESSLTVCGDFGVGDGDHEQHPATPIGCLKCLRLAAPPSSPPPPRTDQALALLVEEALRVTGATLAGAWHPPDKRVERHGDGHVFLATCALCKGDVPALVAAIVAAVTDTPTPRPDHATR